MLKCRRAAKQYQLQMEVQNDTESPCKLMYMIFWRWPRVFSLKKTQPFQKSDRRCICIKIVLAECPQVIRAMEK